ncbi:MAG: hypothetical protein ACJ8AO_07745 [Gemmatimonadaceae bacterium]
MNVATITMPRADAERALLKYRAGLRLRADEEYGEIARAYEVLAKGTPILNMAEVMRQAPRDERGRPRLAMARADRRQVMFGWSWRHDSRATFDASSRGLPTWGNITEATRRNEGWGLFHSYDIGPRPDSTNGGRELRGFALVPIVPPDVRGRRDLRKHFILWEVEAWADQRIGAKPDIDPYLLQPLGGDVYAVVGEWNLTDVERMVLANRARPAD